MLKLYDTTNVPGAKWHIFLHSWQPDVVEACRILSSRGNVHVYDYGTNRGLARSWNEGLVNAYRWQGADVAFIANDDACCGNGPDDLMRLAERAVRNRDDYMISGHGLDLSTGVEKDMLFSLAAINPIALRTMGLMDENFFPIYFEDIDYYRRATLARLTRAVEVETRIIHAGSKSRWTVPGNDAQHNFTFSRNRDYYIKKWGGDQGQEQYAMPFNDPRFGLHIGAEERCAPYPGYNRTDQEIVTV